MKIIRASLKQIKYWNRGSKKEGWIKSKYWPFVWHWNWGKSLTLTKDK